MREPKRGGGPSLFGFFDWALIGGPGDGNTGELEGSEDPWETPV